MRVLLSILLYIFSTYSSSAAEINIITGVKIDRISIIGEIKEGDYNLFLNKISNNNLRNVELYIDSPGGAVLDGMLIADYVRKNAISTISGQLCASSCFLIFSAGSTRTALPSSKIGVHGAYNITASQEAGNVTIALIQRLKQWGVPISVLGQMAATPSVDIYWLSNAEINEMASVNEFGAAPPATESTRVVPEVMPQPQPKKPTVSVLPITKRQAEKSVFQAGSSSLAKKILVSLKSASQYSKFIKENFTDTVYIGNSAMSKLEFSNWQMNELKRISRQKYNITAMNTKCEI